MGKKAEIVMGIHKAFSCLCIILVLGSAQLSSAQSMPVGNSQVEPALIELHGQKIAMYDGASLSVDIYRPPGTERVPAPLAITPYGKGLGSGGVERARWYAQRGYAVILADMRVQSTLPMCVSLSFRAG